MLVEEATPGLRSRLRALATGARFRGLARDTIVYAGGGALARSVSFFLTPLLTRALSPDHFGILDVLVTVQTMAVAIAGLNLDTALARYFYEYQSEEERRRYVGSVLWPVLLLGMAAALLLSAAAGLASHRLFGTGSFSVALVAVAWGVPFTLFATTGLSVLRFERCPGQFIAFSVSGAVVQFVAVVIAVLMRGGDLTAVVSAQVAAQAVLGLAIGYRCRKYLAAGFQHVYLRRALAFAMPQFPSVLVSWYLTSANRFFLVGLSGLAAVTTFAAAGKINALMLAVVQAFTLAWTPFAMSIMHQRDARQIYVRVMYVVVAAFSLLAAILPLGARFFLYYYAGPSYVGAALAGSILVLAASIANGFGWFLSLGPAITERPIFLSLALGVAFVANTLLNVWLIPRWGAEGAALAILGGHVARIAMLAVVCHRLYPLPYRRIVWAGPCAAALVILAARWGGIV